MRNLTYAGIGSRETPEDTLAVMMALASRLVKRGWFLRTGGAVGADAAFALGAELAGGAMAIELPWAGYNGLDARHGQVLDDRQFRLCVPVVAQLHPFWERCKSGAQRLHARNVVIVLGAKMHAPVDAVVCWTPGGQPVGGTAMGIRIAEHHGIPVFNLALMSGKYVDDKLALIEDTKDFF